MIITPPTLLDSFSRCEHGYKLLKVGDRYAIEWDPGVTSPAYAIMIDNEILARDCFDRLRSHKMSYHDVIDKVEPLPEDIINDCPWEYSENFEAGIEKRYDGDYWNYFDMGNTDFPVRIGPYDTFEEAVEHFLCDRDIATEVMEHA